jgi:hypothetical protein
VTEEDVVWSDEEVEDAMEVDEEEEEDEPREKEKTWKEADCRIIVNVRPVVFLIELMFGNMN